MLRFKKINFHSETVLINPNTCSDFDRRMFTEFQESSAQSCPVIRIATQTDLTHCEESKSCLKPLETIRLDRKKYEVGVGRWQGHQNTYRVGDGLLNRSIF